MQSKMENESKCWLCDDYDVLAEMVCYLPNENGGSSTIPINYCPRCGKRIQAEEKEE